MDVDDFLAELEPGEFDAWQAAYILDPWGPERLDKTLARFACAVETLVRESTWSESDFVERPGPFDQLDGDDMETGQTTEEQVALLQAWYSV